jgi:DNA-binding HxlR family transcriptional regulator
MKTKKTKKKTTAAKEPKRQAKRRSPCPVACTLDLIGDKWTLLVVRDLFLGKARFGEFTASPEGIATNILAERLSRLMEAGLAERFRPADDPGAGPARDAYRLTERGRTLESVLRAVADWGLTHIEGTAAKLGTIPPTAGSKG